MAVGALATWGEWWPAVALTAGAMTWIHDVTQRVFYRVIATASEVWIRTGWFERVLSWRSVDTVEVDEDRVSLETDEDWHVVGGVKARQVSHVAAVFETLRLRARTGLPSPAVRRRPTPSLFIEGGYLIVCAAILALTRWNPF